MIHSCKRVPVTEAAQARREALLAEEEIKLILHRDGVPGLVAHVEQAVAAERARILTAADQLALGPRQGPTPRPTFEECRRAARSLLGDATDWIRSGDWRPLPTLAQRDAVRRALSLMSEAEDALDEAATMDTIDLDEEDR